MNTLVVAEHDNSGLKPSTLSAVCAAASLSGPVCVLVAGHQCRAVAQAAARVKGITKVIHVDAVHYRYALAEELGPLVVNSCKNASHVLAPATTFGRDLMPRVAALLGVAAISDIIRVVSDNTFVRPIYAGNALATIQSHDPIKVLTVRTTGFEPAAAVGGTAIIEMGSALPVSGLSRMIRQKLTESSRPELATARIIISAGGGLGSLENFQLLEKIADRLGAAIGGSRAAVDAGYIPNDHVIGQSGKTVAPDLYIAVGISGAVQHLAGMKDSGIIVAINKDSYAPIFEVADYGLVGDLSRVLPEFLEALNQINN